MKDSIESLKTELYYLCDPNGHLYYLRFDLIYHEFTCHICNGLNGKQMMVLY